jgi:hypothetical protein
MAIDIKTTQSQTNESPAAKRHIYRFHAPHLHLQSVFGDDWFALKAEAFARFFGTPSFLIAQTVIVANLDSGQYPRTYNIRHLSIHPPQPCLQSASGICGSTHIARADTPSRSRRRSCPLRCGTSRGSAQRERATRGPCGEPDGPPRGDAPAEYATYGNGEGSHRARRSPDSRGAPEGAQFGDCLRRIFSTGSSSLRLALR